MSWRYLVCNPQLLAFGTHLFTKSHISKVNKRGNNDCRSWDSPISWQQPRNTSQVLFYWTKQAVLFSPCTPATTLNSQYKNVHSIKTVFYSIYFLAIRWSLIWIYTVSSGLSCVYSILQYPFIRCTYMPYLTLWDKISQNLAHLESNSHKKF